AASSTTDFASEPGLHADAGNRDGPDLLSAARKATARSADGGDAAVEVDGLFLQRDVEPLEHDRDEAALPDLPPLFEANVDAVEPRATERVALAHDLRIFGVVAIVEGEQGKRPARVGGEPRPGEPAREKLPPEREVQHVGAVEVGEERLAVEGSVG